MVAWVVEMVDRPGGREVIMELIGAAGELAEALTRAHVTAG